MRPRRLAPALAAATALAACAEEPGGAVEKLPPTLEAASAGALVAYAVNYPLLYFAERIGGERVRVVFPAPAGVDPAFWSPDPETVAAYQGADRVLLNGAGYARWVERATLRRKRLVDTSAGIRERLIPLEDGVTHGHGPAGQHTHAGFASTTWLDPAIAIEQARAVADAFAEARPAGEVAFGAGFDALASDLRALDARLARAAERIGDAPLVFSHPVYAYLAARYGLNGRSLHWEPNRVPDAEEWRALEALLAEHPARFMIWEDTPLEETAKQLEAMGVQTLVYQPCGNAPDGADFLGAMHRNAKALEAITETGPLP